MKNDEILKRELPDYLSKIGVNPKKNFNCLNPNHDDKNPSMAYDSKREKVHCFSCEADWDIFDVIAVEELGAPVVNNQPQYDFKKAKKVAQQLFTGNNYSDTLSDGREGTSKRVYDQKQSINRKEAKNAQRGSEGQINASKINEEFIKRSQIYFSKEFNSLSETDRSRLEPFRAEAMKYIKKRGIDAETARKFNLGYIANWVSPTARAHGANPKPTPRLIIPTSKNSYIARDTRANIPENEQKYRKMKEGPVRIFNGEALKENQPIFIVEGEIDALSILKTGLAPAIGLGSVANVRKFVGLVKSYQKQRPDNFYPTLLLALDNDPAGQKAKTALKAQLDQLGVTSYEVQIARGHKDANEALVADRVKFAEDLKRTLQDPANRMQALLDYINESEDIKPVATGIMSLDEVLDGGLYEGLYGLGAISSLGKTTLALQIADYIAEIDKRPVLYFALEMGWQELMAKSISRTTFERTVGDDTLAQSTRSILKGRWKERYNKAQYDNVMASFKAYGDYQHRIEIHDGSEKRPTVADIAHVVDNYVGRTGEKPVVIVDYLQILKPSNERATDKANVTTSVNQLKKIATHYHIPVIAISSFNRSSYEKKVSMDAFKESGEIEYSSDVLIGLQFKGIDVDGFDINEAKEAEMRRIEAVILKNRNGVTGKVIDLCYYPMFNKYVDPRAGEEAENEEEKIVKTMVDDEGRVSLPTDDKNY